MTKLSGTKFTLSDEFSVTRAKISLAFPVNVKSFGAKADGVTDDTFAIQSALNLAATSERSVYFPAGVYLISATLNLNSKFCLFGDGPASVIKTNLAIPAVTVTTTDASILGAAISDLAFLGPNTTNVNSCGLLFTGTGSTLVYHCTFSRLTFENFNAAVKDVKPARSTAFGLEAHLNWNIWTDIQIISARTYGYWLTQGSGTGNSWTGQSIRVRDSGAACWHFGGAGCVVGDVLIGSAQLTCNAGSGGVGIEIGDDTVYRAQWSVSAQFDAGIDTPAKQSAVGSVPYSNWNFQGCNWGGSTNFASGVQPLKNATVAGQNASQWITGFSGTTSTIGAVTDDIFSVTLSNLDGLSTGCFLEIVVEGTVAGVATSAGVWTFLVRKPAGDAVVTEVSEARQPSSPSTIFDIATTVNAGTVLFTLSFTSTQAGSSYNCYLRAVGGNAIKVQSGQYL